ncbi:hypothetical protein D3C76_904310 [compost metagenome]
MHEAFAIAQAQGTDSQAFDSTGVAGVEHYPVADGNGVLDQDEQPGNHILHQLLRAKADGQADHPGTGQQWRDVDAQVGHGGDGADDDQDDLDGVAQHRQDGPYPGTRLARSAAPHRRLERFLDGSIEHHPQQPGDQQDQADARQRIADGLAQAVAQRKADHRDAPDAPQQFDEGHCHGDTQQRVGQAAQQFLVRPYALPGIRFARCQQVLQQGAEKHRGHQQHRCQQGLLQCLLAFFAGADQVNGRHQDHQQDRQIPQHRKDPQGFLHGAMLHAVLEGAVADQVRDRAAQADHQAGEDEGGNQAGGHGDAGGEVAAQLAGDLWAGQGVAPGSEKADHEQRAWGQAFDHRHSGALVAGIEQGHQAEDDRGRKQAAAGGIGQAQAQCACH